MSTALLDLQQVEACNSGWQQISQKDLVAFSCACCDQPETHGGTNGATVDMWLAGRTKSNLSFCAQQRGQVLLYSCIAMLCWSRQIGFRVAQIGQWQHAADDQQQLMQGVAVLSEAGMQSCKIFRALLTVCAPVQLLRCGA